MQNHQSLLVRCWWRSSTLYSLRCHGPGRDSYSSQLCSHLSSSSCGSLHFCTGLSTTLTCPRRLFLHLWTTTTGVYVKSHPASVSVVHSFSFIHVLISRTDCESPASFLCSYPMANISLIRNKKHVSSSSLIRLFFRGRKWSLMGSGVRRNKKGLVSDSELILNSESCKASLVDSKNKNIWLEISIIVPL